MDCEFLKEQLLEGFSRWTKVRELASGECLVRLPFWDGAGDPIELSVVDEGGIVTIDDAGSIAGLLFSLDQHEEGSPSFELIERLERALDLEIDFDEGSVRLKLDDDDLYDGIAEMTKVVLSMHTVVPHICTPLVSVSRRPARSRRPRLTTKISERYRKLNILDRVERSRRIEGAKHAEWNIDFHWLVHSNGHAHGVNVVTADLGVGRPLDKVSNIVTLSVDTKAHHRAGGDELRVVIETGAQNPRSVEAADLLRFHSEELLYDVFDLNVETESSDFFAKSENELNLERSLEAPLWQE